MPDMEPLPLGPLVGNPDTLPELSTSPQPAAPIGPLGMLPIGTFACGKSRLESREKKGLHG
ncbi:unnamed protein product [Tuwongella immobilis]|uniref:Uncharacterized protein n=1 Tax=Tuwongella immobilis TaxID=692036 RepID=A0A6C2YHQ9_9BACT|nr:unnamed protein product [Tuwongella immobilis]VTR97000.1 unnamed protein product [Tuwongella immobilis]